MMDVLMGELVSFVREKSRSPKGATEYEELKVNDEPIRMRCRLERKIVRTYEQGKVEKTGDARMWWRIRKDGVPEEGDLVLTTRGETYRIGTVEEEKAMGFGRLYGRATLTFSRVDVPTPAHTGDD